MTKKHNYSSAISTMLSSVDIIDIDDVDDIEVIDNDNICER